MRRVILTGTVLFVALLIPALLFGAKPQRPLDTPRSALAVAASTKYEDEIEKLNQDYARKHDILRQQYIKELDAARKAALTKEDLDEAQRLLSEKNRVRDEKAPNVPRPGFHILYAKIGAYDKWIDIAPELQRRVKDSRLYMAAPGPSLPDPLPNKFKGIVIVYAFNGKVYLSTTGTEDTINIP
jgi:hypothetical protein